MPKIDLIFLAVLAFFALKGLRAGLIKSVVSLLGVVLSVMFASRYYAPVGEWLVNNFDWAKTMAKSVVFALAFVLTYVVLYAVLYLIERVLNLITFLPLMGLANRLGGLLFGAFEGSMVLGVIIYFVERFPLNKAVMTMLAESNLAPWLGAIASVVMPFIPKAIKAIESTVNYAENRFVIPQNLPNLPK